MALLAAAGRDKVLVHPKPRVSVISVGDELVELARTPGAGQVGDVCSHALTAAAQDAGAETSRAGLVRGDARMIASAMQDRLPFSDVIVVCGAVGGNAGAEVHAALSGFGEVDTTRVAMHPGLEPGVRSARSGRRADVPVPVLPGHRAAAVRGAGAPADPARAGADRPAPAHWSPPGSPRRSSRSAGRRGYLRGRLLREQATGDYLVQPLGTSGTHLLSSLIDSNGLIVLPEQLTEATVDEPVSVMFLPAPS